jgi:diguanylate cyclase (GGDEF)-like protein
MRRDPPSLVDRRSHRLARRLNAPTVPAEFDDDPDAKHEVAASAQGLQGPELSKQLNRLRFEPALERAFQEEHLPRRRQHVLWCTGFGALTLLVGLHSDARLLPDLAHLLWWMRPLLAALLMASAVWARISPSLTPRRLENLITLQVASVAAFVLWTATSSQALTAVTHSVSLFMVLIYSGVVVFQRFAQAALIGLACMVAYPLLVHGHTPEEALILGENIKLVWIVGSLSLLANYAFERHERHVFWLRQQSLHQRLQLESLKQRLKRQSSLDALTGLFNRRHFDDTLRQWGQVEHRPLSLLMIDVDHFKAYNDRHGHLQGDQCLRTVSGLLADHARRLQGLAARVGGEEFAILLPRCEREDAHFMAQALCTAVRGEAMVHAAEGAGPFVTISVGVSTLGALDTFSGAELYAQADAALYQAKSRGRNQCVQASEQLIMLTTTGNVQTTRGMAPNNAYANASHAATTSTTADPARPMAPPGSARQEEQELSLIEAALAQPAHHLGLPETLQAQQDTARGRSRQRQLLLMGCLGLGAYTLMTLRAGALIPDIQQTFAQVRQGSMVALVAAICSLLVPMSTRIREWLFAFYASALGVGTIYVFSLSQANTVFSFVVAAALIPAFSAIGARQPPAVAWLPAVATVAAMVAWMQGRNPVQEVLVQDSITLVIESSILTLFGCYTLALRQRQTFLLRRKDELQTSSLRRMSTELQRLALTDALTGINNRRQFVLDLDATWAQARETRTPLALMIIDIDCFKPYNDHLGHAQGDLCLRHVAQALARQARDMHGLPARLGGEEFAIILNGESASQALSCARQLCLGIEALGLPHPRSTVGPVLTISVGVTVMEPHRTRLDHTELLALADEALYEAKTLGRNRAVQLRSPTQGVHPPPEASLPTRAQAESAQEPPSGRSLNPPR